MSTLLGLDIGEKRIGVARADTIIRLASPLQTVANDELTVSRMQQICSDQTVIGLVAGLPRGLQGQETGQTRYARRYGQSLADALHVPIYFTDEALTSRQAEAELRNRGKTYVKADIDALAATYILEDFLNQPDLDLQLAVVDGKVSK